MATAVKAYIVVSKIMCMILRSARRASDLVKGLSMGFMLVVVVGIASSTSSNFALGGEVGKGVDGDMVSAFVVEGVVIWILCGWWWEGGWRCSMCFEEKLRIATFWYAILEQRLRSTFSARNYG